MSKKPASPLRVAIYSRVSSDRQTTENQERELQAIAGRLGWIVVKVYRDQGISGSKGREGRPAFDALCKDASRRQFDLIAAWSVDRLGRSLQDLVGFLTEIHALGVNLFLHQQGIDTTTPAGKALFQMMGVFAEFERAMIQAWFGRCRTVVCVISFSFGAPMSGRLQAGPDYAAPAATTAT